MSAQDDDTEKSFDPTPQKLQKAREKGEVARSNDLSVVAAYAGFLLALLAFGQHSLQGLGAALTVLVQQPDRLAPLFFGGSASGPTGGLVFALFVSTWPWFLLPAVAVILTVLAQRAFVVAPSKLQPKLSRISLVSNARNKFGRGGIFEFGKSFAKLILYSICLSVFISMNLSEIVASAGAGARPSAMLMMVLLMRFMFLVLGVALLIGAVDYLWQSAEHIRKNRMSRKEITDEMKEAEGDPHMKQQRRQRGQDIAMNQMMADVPDADVVIVNPTHYAIALKWSRLPGSAPVCVAKGVDEIAATIRRTAIEAGVPVHSDPPTARALHASVEIGAQISEELFRPVAAAIRFAEDMRTRAKGKI